MAAVALTGLSLPPAVPTSKKATVKPAVKARPPVPTGAVRGPTPSPVASPVEAFLARIGAESAQLSRQLKVIARYIEQHRDHIALERIQDVATRCEVQPSAVIRFAKHFGFTGYSEMQKLFRDGVAERIAPSGTYQARIRDLIAHGSERLSSADIADEFIGGAIAGMQELRRDLHGSTLGDAVELLAHAPSFWIAGSRRAFPVAAYLAYALQHTDRPVQLLAALGAMHEGQLRGLREGDVMIAVSFAPYAAETLLAAQQARAAGARLIAITDSRLSPLAPEADATLLVQESSSFGFRALSNTMALAQSLFIALAYRLELDYQPGAARASASSSPA